LPYAELPAFVGELREQDGLGARALEFTILTAARTGEVLGARWDEIDFDTATWTVPAGRMKSGRQHTVPLSAQALKLLRDLPHEDGNAHLFVGSIAGGGLGKMALHNVLKSMGRRGQITVHGFRSSFRDWCGETTNFPREVAEMALAHAVGDASERSYARGPLIAKRVKLMAAWAKFATLPPVDTAGNVTPMHGRGGK
jgi:integrase